MRVLAARELRRDTNLADPSNFGAGAHVTSGEDEDKEAVATIPEGLNPEWLNALSRLVLNAQNDISAEVGE